MNAKNNITIWVHCGETRRPESVIHQLSKSATKGLRVYKL